MNKLFKKSQDFENTEIKELKKDITILEKELKSNQEEALKDSNIIMKYFHEKLKENSKKYDDQKTKNYFSNLNQSQKNIFSDIDNFDNHNQATIQNCFRVIHVCIADQYENERTADLDHFANQLFLFEKDHLKNISDIKLEVSKYKEQNHEYALKVNSQIQSAQTKAESSIRNVTEHK